MTFYDDLDFGRYLNNLKVVSLVMKEDHKQIFDRIMF